MITNNDITNSKGPDSQENKQEIVPLLNLNTICLIVWLRE